MSYSVQGGAKLELKSCVVDGRKASYLHGGQGKMLFFLHGWATNPGVYGSALAGAASLGYEVVAPYLPGNGPSDPISAKGSMPSLDVLTGWFKKLVDAVGNSEQIVLAGHSLGGGLAASFADRYPEGIERLYLLSSVGGHANSKGELIELRSSLEWSLSIPIDLVNSAIAPKHLVSMVGVGLSQFIRDPKGLWELSKLARNYQICAELDRLAKRSVKITVVGAKSDRVISRYSVARIAKCAQVEPIWVQGTHSWISTHPDQFVQLLTSLS